MTSSVKFHIKIEMKQHWAFFTLTKNGRQFARRVERFI